MATLAEKSFPVALLLFGTLILCISLLSANSSSAGDRTRLMARKVYFSSTILPDNVIYPVLMVGDRVKLMTAGDEAKILLKVEFAERRYGYALQLLEKDQPMLALATLTKSQKYLFAAGNEVLVDPKQLQPETIKVVQDAFALSVQNLANFKQKYPNSDTQTIDDLNRDTVIIYQKLSTLDSQIIK